jgi:hypothetical protein
MSRYSMDPNEHLATGSCAEIEAWLAIERGALLAQLAGLDERILCEQPVMEGWTIKDLLAHVAYWDAYFADSVALALAGRASEVSDVNLDERNAQVSAERRNWSLAETLAECERARAGFLAVFGQAPVDLLDVEQPFGWGEASLRRCALWRGYHDRTHAAHIAAWRLRQGGVLDPSGVETA